jgi:glucose/arabinose dehydrogenase/sugar lactone lactonase YvrE
LQVGSGLGVGPRVALSIGFIPALILSLLIVGILAPVSVVNAQPPVNFTKIDVLGPTTNLHLPTAFDFAPDGRIFVLEKRGDVMIVETNGTLDPKPLLDITSQVNANGERGLLGIDLDPNFSTTTPYIYLFYTNANPLENHVSRFTLLNQTYADPNSEKILLRTDTPRATYHQAGDVRTSPDGYLFATFGENGQFSHGNLTASHNPDILDGKLARIFLNGTVPQDNPYVNMPGFVPQIWSYGFRNPYHFSISPNGIPIVGDVGQNTWEDVDIATKGTDFTWSKKPNPPDGPCNGCGYANPVYAYNHNTTIPDWTPSSPSIPPGACPITDAGGDTGSCISSAVTGGMIFGGNNNYPAQYQGLYFFGDYERGFVHTLSFDPSFTKVIGSQSVFDDSAGYLVDFRQGPNGNLYYITVNGNNKTSPSDFYVNGGTIFEYVYTHPRFVNLTFNTNILGLALVVNGTLYTGSAIIHSAVSHQLTISTLDPQTLQQNTYRFTGWSDGGSITHTIWTPSSDTVYTATFTSPTGNVFTSFGSHGSATGQLNQPFGVAISSGTGNIYVADTGNNRIDKFSSSGSFITSFGSGGDHPGQFNHPSGVAIDSGTGNIYVADTGNNRIDKFSSSGSFITSFGSHRSTLGQLNQPFGVAIDSGTGNIYVADTGNNRIDEFSSSGSFITSFGSHGSAAGQLNQPFGVAISSGTGNIYVADTGNNRIDEFSSSGSFITLKPINSVPWGNNVVVSGKLIATSSGTGLGGKTITFGGTGAGGLPPVTTNSDGTFSVTGPSPNAVASNWQVNANFAGDTSYLASSSATQSYNTLIHHISLTLNPITSIPWGNNVTVSGQLNASGTGLGGKTITFGGTGAGGLPPVTTNSDGTFSVTGPSPNTVASNWQVNANFAGDSSYDPSSATQKYKTIRHGVSLTLVISPSSVAVNGLYSVAGALKDTSTGTFLSGMTISFSATPIIIANTVTNSTGNYNVNGLTAPSITGSYSIKAQFNGGSIYNSYSQTRILIVTS